MHAQVCQQASRHVPASLCSVQRSVDLYSRWPLCNTGSVCGYLHTELQSHAEHKVSLRCCFDDPVCELRDQGTCFQQEVNLVLQTFQAVTSAPNGQVLRYCVEEGAAPLWGRTSPRPDTIPPCKLCGAQRRFEFQILPQMLAFLGIDDTQEDAPDW